MTRKRVAARKLALTAKADWWTLYWHRGVHTGETLTVTVTDGRLDMDRLAELYRLERRSHVAFFRRELERMGHDHAGHAAVSVAFFEDRDPALRDRAIEALEADDRRRVARMERTSKQIAEEDERESPDGK